MGYIRRIRKHKHQIIKSEKGNSNSRGKSRAYCQTIFPCHLCDCSLYVLYYIVVYSLLTSEFNSVREDSLRSHIRHHQDVLPQTGAALAILQLQEANHELNSNDENVINSSDLEPKNTLTECNDITQGAELEVITSERSPKESNIENAEIENTVEVESQLYQRLMQSNSVSAENEPKVSKRGRPLKRDIQRQTNTHSSPPTCSTQTQQSLRLVPTGQSSSGQVLYHLPSSVRVVPYLSVNQSNNTLLLSIINDQTIATNSIESQNE